MASPRYSELLQVLSRLDSLLVAYSGGVDSAFLMHAAHEALGTRCRGVMADSPSLPRAELEEALALARNRGWNVSVLATHELDNSEYAANPPNRCYFCKQELFDRLTAHARAEGFAAIAYGENKDDMADFRPGRQAAEEFRVLAPLRDVGLTKREIRELSREFGLATADKPAQPCLSSRIPHGLPVTMEALAQIERGESILRQAGFRIFRLRHLGNRGRVQVSPEELDRLHEPAMREKLKDQLQVLGLAEIEFAMEPYGGPSLDRA